MTQQRLGIDRLFQTVSGETQAVEYKTDYKTHATGNAFIEDVSVDTADKAGWLHTSAADAIVYYAPGLGEALWLPTQRLRAFIAQNAGRFTRRQCRNRTYASSGFLVPFSMLAFISAAVYHIH